MIIKQGCKETPRTNEWLLLTITWSTRPHTILWSPWDVIVLQTSLLLSTNLQNVSTRCNEIYSMSFCYLETVYIFRRGRSSVQTICTKTDYFWKLYQWRHYIVYFLYSVLCCKQHCFLKNRKKTYIHILFILDFLCILIIILYLIILFCNFLLKM